MHVAPETTGTRPAAVARLGAWTLRALLAYALALALAAAAVAIIALHRLANVGDAPSLGRAILGVLVLLAASCLALALAARTAQLAGAVARPGGVPSPGRATVRAAQALALLAAFLGLVAVASGRAVPSGLAWLAAGILGLVAAAAWTSHVPGARARATVFAVAAGILWLLGSLGSVSLAVPGDWTLAAAFAAALPSGSGLLIATAALLSLALLAQSPTRTLALALLALAALAAAVQALVQSLDIIGAGAWDSLGRRYFLEAAAMVLALGACLALAAAAVLAGIAAGLALAHYGPPLVARAGAGFMAPEPGAICPRCALVAPPGARYCPDCGQALAHTVVPAPA